MYSYQLRENVTLARTRDGVVAVSSEPLLAVQLNEAAATLLEHCHTWRTSAELVAVLGGDSESSESLLHGLSERQLLHRRPLPLNEWPMVSVVVPVRNRADEIVACVDALRRLDYPTDKREVIIVDDASTDATPDVLTRLDGIRVVQMAAWSGPAACRNAGAAVARGEIIAYTDSDCEVTPGWLADLVPYFADPQHGAVGGRIDSFSLQTAIERYESVASSLYMGLEERACRPNSAVPFLPTANLLVRRDVWQRLGGFDLNFPIGEDVDLVWRVHGAGWRVQYVPRGVVQHKYRCHLWSFARRKAFYGGSETLLLLKHPQQRKLFYVPRRRVLFVALLLATVLGGWWPLTLLALLSPLVEGSFAWRRLRYFGAPIGFGVALRATGRSYAALLLHLCGNGARYYVLTLLLLALLVPPLALLALLAYGYTAVYLYVERCPPLDFPRFATLLAVELAAHQIGMLRRCVERRVIGPLVPGVRV